jgi:hypothetical protein
MPSCFMSMRRGGFLQVVWVMDQSGAAERGTDDDGQA